MKVFNKDIYNRNLRDMKSLDKDELKNTYYPWVLDIANGFPTDQVSVGCLDRNDIIQECYLAFETAWERMDWDAIHAAPEGEQSAIIWSFLKKSIKLKVRNRITYVKDGIRTYSVDGARLGGSVDDFLSILFPEFHEDSKPIWEEPVGLWDVEKLAMGLDESMRLKLSDTERMTLELFYGIDCERLTFKMIAEKFIMKEAAIRKQKGRSLKKLKHDDVVKIIQKYF